MHKITVHPSRIREEVLNLSVLLQVSLSNDCIGTPLRGFGKLR